MLPKVIERLRRQDGCSEVPTAAGATHLASGQKVVIGSDDILSE
jgi:hypothetical protein